MFPVVEVDTTIVFGLPHARGDVPLRLAVAFVTRVFPTHVGMFQSSQVVLVLALGLHHARWDVPILSFSLLFVSYIEPV